MDFEEATRLWIYGTLTNQQYTEQIRGFLTLIENQINVLKEDIHISRTAFRAVREGEQLITKLGIICDKLKNTYKSLRKLTHEKYYGAQSHDIPEQVTQLRTLNDLIDQLRIVFSKLRYHIRTQTGDFEHLEKEIKGYRDLLTEYGGITPRKRFLSSLNPLTWIVEDRRNYHFNTNKEGLRYLIGLVAEECKIYMASLKMHFKISESDIYLLKYSLAIVNQAGYVIANSRHIWLREGIHYGPWYCYYKQELDDALHRLTELKHVLEEIADDENFLKASAVEIIKHAKRYIPKE